MKRLIGISSTGLVLALLTTTAVPQPADRQSCVDLVAIGKLVAQEPTPFPGGLVMSWPWKLTVDAERVLYGTVGTRLINLTTILHARIVSDGSALQMFMLRRSATGYVTADIRQDIATAVKDRRGRFVMPIPEPLPPQYLFPQSWIPADYEQYLQPIDYDYRDFELDSPPHWENEYNAGSDWLVKLDGHLYAKRGLPLDEVPNFLVRSGLNCR